jgi:hypothetical protein
VLLFELKLLIGLADVIRQALGAAGKPNRG